MKTASRWVAALAACAWLASGTAHADTPHERAARMLRGNAYPFCHDAQRWVRPGDMRYCGYVDARSACPEFAQACDRMNHPRSSCGAPRNLGAVQGVGRIVMLVAIVALAGLLLFLALRSIARARRERDLADVAPAPEERASIVPIPLAGSGELFARALDSHARGEHGAALYALYGALLRKLDERGAIQIDPASTSGDYVRRCREAAARAPLRDTVREVERVRFGGVAPTGDVFERLRVVVEPIVRSVAMIAFVALCVGAPVLGCGNHAGGGGGSGETGAGGHRVVRDVLEAEGVHTRVLVEPVDDVDETDRTLVLYPDVSLDEAQWQHVLAWVSRGGSLVLAGGGGWPADLGVQMDNGPHSGHGSIVHLDDVLALGPLQARVDQSPALMRTQNGYAVASFAQDGAPYASLVTRGSGQILVVAGSELWTNGGFAVGTNADLVVALMRRFAASRTLYFIEDAEGGESNPIRSLQHSGLLVAVLQGLLALMLFYVMVGRHFRTPRDRAVRTRRAFAEHVAAVGGLYARAGASRTALRAYASLVLERLRERSGASRAGVVDAIALRTGEAREDVERVYNAIEQAQSSDPVAGRSTAREIEDLRLIKRLNDWINKLA